ncbi:MAG: hypothetical protein JHC54_15370 [Acinetobacter sp.]|nr:hypothetical protein [Acinetobacter sp.]
MPEIIVNQTQPTGASTFDPVSFNRNDFNSLIWHKGYDVFIERAVKCPCKSKGGDSHLSSCLNCGGTGWFFINKKRTKMVLSSMSVKTQYRDYGEQSIGKVTVTAMSSDDIAHMDRITVIDGTSIFSQVVYPKTLTQDSSKIVVSCVYEIIEIIDCFVFRAANQSLLRITDVQISSNKILLNPSLLTTYGDDLTVSIRYKHRPTYHLVDISREIMNSQSIDVVNNQKEQSAKFPLHAVADRAHYIFPSMSYYSSNGAKIGDLFDNSYEDLSCLL